MGRNATDRLLCVWDTPWGKSELMNWFHVNLKCVDDSYVSLFATEKPTICAPVYRPDIPLHVLGPYA